MTTDLGLPAYQGYLRNDKRDPGIGSAPCGLPHRDGRLSWFAAMG